MATASRRRPDSKDQVREFPNRPKAPQLVADFELESPAPAPQPEGHSPQRYSYTSLKMGPLARVRELYSLARVSLRPQAPGARHTVQTVQRAERMILEMTGKRIRNCNVLEVGPGQQLRHLRCFAVHNDVTGIDTDPIPQGFDARAVARVLRTTPWMRGAKTLGRVALRKDARFQSALARELGVKSFPRVSVLQMDATRMTFPDASFDLVFSSSVFEHIDDPRAALAEVARVLRPGGVAFISIHLYTSHSGQHDPRIFAEGRPVPPLWPHLRPEFAQTVSSSAYLNKLSLREWYDEFAAEMPGVCFKYERDEDDLTDALAELRKYGKLEDFTDEDLLTVNLVALWQKPKEGAPIS